MEKTDVNGDKYCRMLFKDKKVWVLLKDGKTPYIEDGKAKIKYDLKQKQYYWASAKNLGSLSAQPEGQSAKKADGGRANDKPAGQRKKIKKTMHQGKELDPDAIHIYTDGASSGNPGPAGLGVLMVYKGKEKEISRYLGESTNNIAELSAIKEGLAAVKNRNLKVIVHTDSKYSIGVLTGEYKAKKNVSLIIATQKLMGQFKALEFRYVKGHSGIPGNERADELATSAATTGLDQG